MSDPTPSVPSTAGRIKQYANKVFTNEGQSPVDGFRPKLLKAGAILKTVENLAVYVGYHGDTSGNFAVAFDDGEMAKVRRMATEFPNATLFHLTAAMPSLAIRDAVHKGNVLFTWCDSDTKVRDVMEHYGGALGAPERTFD